MGIKPSVSVGDVFKTNSCGEVKVIKYESAKSVHVTFIKTGYCCVTTVNHLKKGALRDKQLPSLLGVGIIGDTESHINRKPIKEYQLWVDLLNRCYGKTAKTSSYKDCSVSENFKYFPYFKEWCNKQVGFGNKGWHLDKDVLVKGNNVYSEDTCCFIPSEINCVFGTNKSVRGDFPIGVRKYSKGFGFSWRMKIGDIVVSKHGYQTPEDAFYAYKEAKEDRFKALAEQYKTQIDIKVYNALMNRTIEITD